MSQNETDLLRLIAEEVGRRAQEDFEDDLSRGLSLCESPIERVLMGVLLASPIDGINAFVLSDPLTFERLMVAPEPSVEFVGGLYPQVAIGHYRVDLFIDAYDQETGKRWLQLAIECDGHDFHERTKEQARRDKSRDRWFQARGITVLRFTGSEIWRDPWVCHAEIEDTFWKAWERRYRPERS